MGLLAAADQYDLKLLKKKCEELLCKSLNISNCLDYLILADMHSTDILKPLVIRFVVENSREVVTQENWKEKLMTFTDVFVEETRRCFKGKSWSVRSEQGWTGS